jgi:hypothetical protein
MKYGIWHMNYRGRRCFIACLFYIKRRLKNLDLRDS